MTKILPTAPQPASRPQRSGVMRSPRTIPILLKMIDDLAIAPESRQSALEKIRELNEAELVKATPILIRQLGSKSADVRLTAMGMLGSIIENTPALMPAATSAK